MLLPAASNSIWKRRGRKGAGEARRRFPRWRRVGNQDKWKLLPVTCSDHRVLVWGQAAPVRTLARVPWVKVWKQRLAQPLVGHPTDAEGPEEGLHSRLSLVLAFLEDTVPLETRGE